MKKNPVNEGGKGARSGAQTLVLLAQQPIEPILRALAAGPRQQTDLRREAGVPAQTKLRAQLERLTEIGAIVKHRRNRFPGVLEYELAPAGVELRVVAEILERWLNQCPDRPLTLDSTPAKAAIKALADAWSTMMLRAMSTGPISLTELNRIIGSLSYPSLERRFRAMRLMGQIEARSSNGRSRPFAITNWLRQGAAPLAAAAQWERRHLPDRTAPIAPIDTETTFLLTVPLLRTSAELSGSCRMTAEISNGEVRRMAGVVIAVENGVIVSCVTRLQGDADAWASGSPSAWLSAVVEDDRDGLEMGGDGTLARTLLNGLHQALFAAPARRPASL